MELVGYWYEVREEPPEVWSNTDFLAAVTEDTEKSSVKTRKSAFA